jgi:ribosomal protein S18 acetylase RimI-like enzyme
VAEHPRHVVKVRSYRSSDAAACRRLYKAAVLGGTLAENDTGLDIDDIRGAYMRSPGSHFWVAEGGRGELVGMLGVQSHEAGAAEIRRLRVREDHRRRGIGSLLMERALKFCQDKQYLKVTLDTYMEREPALKMFEKFGFKVQRTRDLHGRTLIYFYLDLYKGEPRPKKKV